MAEMMIPCPICSEALRFTVTTNKNGKHAIGLHCPRDGRHFRGFINHKPFVEEALTRMAEATEGANADQSSDQSVTVDRRALQNHSEGPSAKLATKDRGRTG